MESNLTDFFKEIVDPSQTVIHKGRFPLIWGPASCEVRTVVALQEAVEKHHQEILRKVSDIGAVVFRGFDIQNANEYASVLHKLGLGVFEFGGVDTCHLVVGAKGNKKLQVFVANESLASEPIPLHNSSDQTQNCPEFVSFYCHAHAENNGSMPIINYHRIYSYVESKHPAFIKELESKGVRYNRVLEELDNPDDPTQRGWRSIFHVVTREQAEEVMKERGYEWQWFDTKTNDCKLTSKRLPAIRIAKNGEKVFCTQLLRVFKGLIDHKNNPMLCLKYGDDSQMPLAVLEDICLHAPQQATTIHWLKGDFVVVDNDLTSHFRESFAGPNKIYAAMMRGKNHIQQGPNLVLNSGTIMPCIGFGTWKIPNEHCADTVYQAIKAGYRLIDCACDYGNEKQVGEGIAKAIKQQLVTREELFITSKLWNTYHQKAHVKEACLKTLKDLNLDYIDLYLVHFPISLKFVPFEERYPPQWVHNPQSKHPKMIQDHVPMTETWQAMEQLVKERLVRNIGVANFNVGLLRDLINNSHIKPSVLQVEIHPFLTQKKLIRFCREHGVQVTSYSTFGATSYLNLQLGDIKKSDEVLKDPVITQLAKKYNRTPGQIVLRWAVQQGVAVIPKSEKMEHLQENHKVSGWLLSAQDMNEIDALNRNQRFNDPGVYCEQKFGCFCPIFE